MRRRKKFILAGVAVLFLTGTAGLTAAAFNDGHYRGGKGMGREMGHKIFKTFDENDDGAITTLEVTTLVNKSIGEFDRNESRTLTLDEFEGLWLSHLRPHMVDRFQHLDENGDGEVSQAEMEEILLTLHSRFDRNEDGAVTKREIKKAHRHHKHRHGSYHDDDDDDDDKYRN
ncbi:MAG: hypothetical protein R3245_00865 [Kiloniellales bacterium]|nr:hypothetical protein [Kiloniellales bacterium]